MSPPKKRLPLTREQQATVTQWRPCAIKFMRRAIIARGLSHYEDETEGLAAEALMGAVNVWDPKRGSFATCLAWWVKSVAKTFHAHGARTVQQSPKKAESQDAWSLNKAVHVNSHGGAEVVTTWQDVLADESLSDPTEDVDARRLARAVPLLLPTFMARKNERRAALAYAEESFSLWHRRNFSDEEVTLEALASELGVSRERVRQRVEKVQQEFERWARPLREEAA